MKLFGQIVRTVVNVAVLPVEMARDVGDLMTGDFYGLEDSHTAERLAQLKEEASEDDD